jgi:hypothetical protein
MPRGGHAPIAAAAAAAAAALAAVCGCARTTKARVSVRVLCAVCAPLPDVVCVCVTQKEPVYTHAGRPNATLPPHNVCQKRAAGACVRKRAYARAHTQRAPAAQNDPKMKKKDLESAIAGGCPPPRAAGAARGGFREEG